MRMIGAHPAVQTHDEIFNSGKKSVVESARRLSLTPWQVWESINDGSLCTKYRHCALLDDEAFRSLGPCQSCAGWDEQLQGVKALYYQTNVSRLLAYCESNNVPVIHLIRASSFRKTISRIFAHETGKWQPSEEQQLAQVAVPMIALPLSRLETAVRMEENLVAHYVQELADSKVRHMTVFYEELRLRADYLAERHIVQPIFDFLGLDPVTDQQLAGVQQFQTARVLNYHNHIANLEEVREAYPFAVCELEHGSVYE